jgi:hypothetical protein
MTAEDAGKRRLYRPRPANVVAAADGVPRAVGRARVEAVREEWLVEDRWWTSCPLRRRYFELVTEGGANAIVFRELERGSWHLQAGA